MNDWWCNKSVTFSPSSHWISSFLRCVSKHVKREGVDLIEWIHNKMRSLVRFYKLSNKLKYIYIYIYYRDANLLLATVLLFLIYLIFSFVSKHAQSLSSVETNCCNVECNKDFPLLPLFLISSLLLLFFSSLFQFYSSVSSICIYMYAHYGTRKQHFLLIFEQLPDYEYYVATVCYALLLLCN